ncbi:hypothetical protein BD410DRAFT_781447 [Rickenella mellea]|uniref:F-box domain-containing protein n=1 Tax=Rickenella mellea TaxID=50990 RepID=A0A4Y7QNN4_9AGAM|nr:hypothetical protein BD410DRAFT_781447 [Rickenella mellea]
MDINPFNLLQIPVEITELALVLAHPKDVARFAQTCRAARALVYDSRDQHLWRRMFLAHPFDDPRMNSLGSVSPDALSYDWKSELQRRVSAADIIRKCGDTDPLVRTAALQTLVSVIMNAPPVITDDRSQSKSLSWIMEVIDDGALFRVENHTEEEVQLTARLRCYLGFFDEDKVGRPSAELRTVARCFVYDLRNYSSSNRWGPYIRDNSRRVNWKHVEAIITVVYLNLVHLGGMWQDTRPPLGVEATRAYSAPGSLHRDPRDWAGVEGCWRRYVCFMDYRDLFAFNFSTTTDVGPYDPSFFEDVDFNEAVRLIELRLRVTNYTNTPSTYPKIEFTGLSRGANGQEAKVRGSVSMGDDGVVRWRFRWKSSIYDGHSQWSSEGIQIGCVGSAAGIVGTWTGAQHEDGEPAGPFWLWKVNDDHPTHV